MHNLQIHEQGSTFKYKICSTKCKISTDKNAFQALECYSPTSSQVRVLVIQASVAAYLQDSPLRFFSCDLLNTRKQRNSYQRATYEGNFSRVLNQEFLFLFTSSGVHKQPVLCEVLAPASLLYKEATCKGSILKRLLTQRKQYHKRTTVHTLP